MRKCLLFSAALTALALAGPAGAQYVFLDVNGDALNSNTDTGLPDDVLNSGVTSVDVYYDTDTNRDGSAAVCAQGPDPFTIISYELSMVASGSGTVTFGTWTDNMGFSVNLVPCPNYCTLDSDIWIAKGSGVAQAPGKYRVGTLAITVTGDPVLSIVPGVPAVSAVSATSFGSNCPGVTFDNTLRYGPDLQLHDFRDADGTEGGTPVKPATWGEIKKLYR